MKHKQLINMRSRYDGLLKSTQACRMDAKEMAELNFRQILDLAINQSGPKEKPKTTMADHYPAGGLQEPCQYCLDASEKTDEIVSKIDIAVGMITVAAVNDNQVLRAKDILIQASMDVGELFEV